MESLEHDPRQCYRGGTWEEQPAADAFARMSPEGRQFFELLFEELPALASGACFLRWSRQPEDVFAGLRWPGGSACVATEPGGTIVVHSARGTAEFHPLLEEENVLPAVLHVLAILREGE